MSGQDEWYDYLRNRFGMGPTRLMSVKEKTREEVATPRTDWKALVQDLVNHHEHPEQCNVWHGWQDVECDCGYDEVWDRARAALGET